MKQLSLEVLCWLLLPFPVSVLGITICIFVFAGDKNFTIFVVQSQSTKFCKCEILTHSRELISAGSLIVLFVTCWNSSEPFDFQAEQLPPPDPSSPLAVEYY